MISPDLVALRHALKLYRDENGITIDQITADSGLARQTVLNLLGGHTDGTLIAWFKLAQGLRLPFAIIAAILDDPGEYQYEGSVQAPSTHPPVRQLIDQILTEQFPGCDPQSISTKTIHEAICEQYPEVTMSAVRMALWRMRTVTS